MIPTRRLLLLLLLGIGPVLIAVSTHGNGWIVWLYLALVVTLVGIDWRATPKPELIDIARINEPKLSLGAQNRIALALHNTSPRALKVVVRDEFPVEFPTDTVLLSGEVEPDEVHEFEYYVRPTRRGDYRFGNINVRYTSVLGFFQRQMAVQFDEVVKVYPNILDMRKYDLLAQRGLLAELGLRASRLYGSGTEFESLRDYTPDDEFRRINWRASARRGKLIASEFETERSQYIVSVLDTGRLMRTPIGDIARLDYAINAALMMSYVAMLKGDHVGLLAFADHVGRFLPPRRGKVGFYQILETMYNLPSQPVESDYGRALAYLGLKNKRRSLVVLYTDLSTPDAVRPLIQHIGRLAKTHLVVCVVMSDPNVVGYVNKRVTNTTAVFERAVAEMVIDERRVMLDTLVQAGVQIVDVPADKLTVAVVNKYMEMKGRGLI